MKYAAVFPLAISSQPQGTTADWQVPLYNSVLVQPCSIHLQEGSPRASSFAAIPFPGGITTDPDGYTYVTESTGPWIHRISPDGTHHATWAEKAETNRIARASYGLVVHQGFLYISYSNSGRVVKIDLDNPAKETTVLSGLPGAFGIAVREEFLYVATHYYGKVIKVHVDAVNEVYKSTTHDHCRVPGARGICFDSTGNLYIAAYGAGMVFKHCLSGTTRPAITDLPSYLTGVCVNEQDELYVCFNAARESMRKYSADLRTFSHPYTAPKTTAASLIWCMSVNASGALLVGAFNSNEVVCVTQPPAIKPVVARSQQKYSSDPLSCFPCRAGIHKPDMVNTNGKPDMKVVKTVKQHKSSPTPAAPPPLYIAPDKDQLQQLQLWQ